MHWESAVVEVEVRADANRGVESAEGDMQPAGPRRRKRQHRRHDDGTYMHAGLYSELREMRRRKTMAFTVKRRKLPVASHADIHHRHLVEQRVLQQLRIPVRRRAAPLALRPVTNRAFANRQFASVNTLYQRDNAPKRAKARPRLYRNLAICHIKRISLRLVNRRVRRKFYFNWRTARRELCAETGKLLLEKANYRAFGTNGTNATRGTCSVCPSVPELKLYPR